MRRPSRSCHFARVVSIAAWALLACCALVSTTADAGRADTAPIALELVDMQGIRHSLAEYAGDIVVVNFWATWCFPCREEMPMLERLSREYADRGVRFVAASTDEATTRDLVPEAIDEAGVTFAVWLGATTLDMKRFDVGTGLPATAVVDRRGAVAFRLIGRIEEEELRAKLDRLLADPSARESLQAANGAAAVDDCCAADAQHEDDHGDEAVADAEEHHGHGHDHAHDHEGGNEGYGGADVSLVPS